MRTVLVTGASRGIGQATATAFAAQGCNVVLTSRQQDALDTVAGELAKAYPQVDVLPVAAHAAEPEQVQACVDAAMARFGRLDVLVNNAATNPYYGPLVNLDPVRADKTVRLNQFGVVLWTQAVWRAWQAEHGGAVVNVASLGGMVTEPGIGYYNATKAAVILLTKQFAAELAPGVRVNGVAPGIVRTHLARALWENAEPQLKAAMPLGRIGEPADIAGVITFLASEAAGWITGQTIVVDGGAEIRFGTLSE